MAGNSVLLNEPNISDLVEFFKGIEAEADTRTKLEKELAKLQIIKSAYRIISNAIDKNTALYSEQNLKKETNIFKLFLYYFFLLGGFAQQASGSYIYAFSLFALIPALSNFWLILISIVYTILDCVLFYAFQADLLKSALGLDFSSNDSSRLLKTYEEQLHLIILMNESLTNVSVLGSDIEPDKYLEYVELVQLFNQDLILKNQSMGNYHESICRKMFKYGMYAFGILSTVAEGYFTANALLAAISGGLVGTPIGWVITVCLIISGLAFYYAMEGKSLFHLVNPDYTIFKDLQGKMLMFNNKWPEKLTKDAQIVDDILTKNIKINLAA